MARGRGLRKGLTLGLFAGVGVAVARAVRSRRAAKSEAAPTWPPLPTALAGQPPGDAVTAGPEPTIADPVALVAEAAEVPDEILAAWPPPSAGSALAEDDWAPPTGEAPWAAALLDDLGPGSSEPVMVEITGPQAEVGDIDAIILAEEAALEAEQYEADRLEADRLEAARLETMRQTAERLASERLAAERLEAERAEAERAEAERAEAERAEAERLEEEAALETARLEADRLELAGLEAARARSEEEASAQAERERAREESLARFDAQRREAQALLGEQEERERAAQDTATTRRPMMAADLPGGRRSDDLEPDEPTNTLDDLGAPTLQPLVPDEAMADLDEEPAWGLAVGDELDMDEEVDLGLADRSTRRPLMAGDFDEGPDAGWVEDEADDDDLDLLAVEEEPGAPAVRAVAPKRSGWGPVGPTGPGTRRRPLMTGDFDDVLPEELVDDEDTAAEPASQPVRRSGSPRVPLKARRPAATDTEPSSPVPRPRKAAPSIPAKAAKKAAAPVPGRGAGKAKTAVKKVSTRRRPEVLWVEPVGSTCPPSHPVKASLSSGIFHVVGGMFYERSTPDRCYRLAASAESDGLRQAKR